MLFALGGGKCIKLNVFNDWRFGVIIIAHDSEVFLGLVLLCTIFDATVLLSPSCLAH